jgi:hypothetical protein
MTEPEETDRMAVLLGPVLGPVAALFATLPVPEHLGALHGYERLLVAVIAFGPFVVAGVVVHLMRKRDIAAEEREAEAGGRITSDPRPEP